MCHLQHKLVGFYKRDKSVYCAVRTGYLNNAVCASSLKVASQGCCCEEEGLADKGLLENCTYFEAQNVAFEVFLLFYSTPEPPEGLDLDRSCSQIHVASAAA